MLHRALIAAHPGTHRSVSVLDPDPDPDADSGSGFGFGFGFGFGSGVTPSLCGDRIVSCRSASDTEHDPQGIVLHDHRDANYQQDQRQQRGTVAPDRRAQQRMLHQPHRACAPEADHDDEH